MSFIGTWHGSSNNTSARIEIGQDGSAQYCELDLFKNEFVRKKYGIAKIRLKQLKIGWLNPIYFNIDGYPSPINKANKIIILWSGPSYSLTKDTASWEMWLDGKAWYRK